MTESLIKFRDRITRKAIRNYEENQEVTLQEFIDFVYYKIGTEMDDDYIKDCYDHFLKTREELKKQAAKYRELARQLADPLSSERIIARAVELEAEAKLK